MTHENQNVQAVCNLVLDLSIGEIKAVEDYLMDLRLAKQRAERNKLPKI